jgi:carbonic anhydrase
MCILILILILIFCLAELENDEFSYDEESPVGPSHWGNIKPEWSTCSTGKMQSPINISDYGAVCAPDLGSLRRHYRFSIATLVNRGHDMMVFSLFH